MLAVSPIAQVAASAALLITAAHLVGGLFARFRQPRVIGEIVGGILLGPTVAATLFPAVTGAIFPSAGTAKDVLSFLSQAGLVLLMYSSGMHLRSFAREGERRTVAVLATFGIVVPFLAGLVAIRMIDTAQLLGPANNSTALVLVFATAIAIASIPVISRIMLDLGILDTPFARIVVATAAVDDLLLYVVLAGALSLVQAPGEAVRGLPALLGLTQAGPSATALHAAGTIVAIGATFVLGAPLWRAAIRLPIFGRPWRWLAADNYALVQLAALAATAAMCRWLAVDPIFGALALGMTTSRVLAEQNRGPALSVQRLSLGLLIPLYFASVGFKLDLLRHCDVGFFLGFLAFACLVKGASVYAGARAAGEDHGSALNLAAALNARGGPGIVLASVAFDAQIINQSFFAVLVLTAVATSMIAGWRLAAALRASGGAPASLLTPATPHPAVQA